MSHISTTAATTTPPVMVVSFGLSLVSSVTMAPSLTGFPVSLDQCGVVQPPPLMVRGSGGVIGSASVPQQEPPSSMPLLAYANYAMGSPQVGFFFRVEPPTILYLICLVSILVSAFYFKMWSWMPYSPMGAQPLGLHLCNPLEFAHGRHMCNLVMVIGPHFVCIDWLLPMLLWIGGSLLLLIQLSPTIPFISWSIQPWGLSGESPDPSAFPT